MTKTLTRTPAAAPPVELDLDARMALTLAEMDGRCTTAVLAVDVNSAHIAVDALQITAPLPLTPTLAPSPYSTPIAGLLHRARNRIVAVGWCRDALHDEQGAICPIRAIRLEAASGHQAGDACVLLLDSIQRDFQAETIPSWNKQQTSPAPVLLAFDRAAELAHSRNQ